MDSPCGGILGDFRRIFGYPMDRRREEQQIAPVNSGPAPPQPPLAQRRTVGGGDQDRDLDRNQRPADRRPAGPAAIAHNRQKSPPPVGQPPNRPDAGRGELIDQILGARARARCCQATSAYDSSSSPGPQDDTALITPAAMGSCDATNSAHSLPAGGQRNAGSYVASRHTR